MKLKNLGLGLLALSLLAVPAAADKSRNNKHGAKRGDERVAQVHGATKKDKDRDPAKDNDTKNKGQHKGEMKGQHKAIGHSH